MFTVRKEIEFDAGHRVPYHGSQCRNLHGHRWKVAAVVSAPTIVDPDPQRPDSGMVVDYGVIKKVLMEQVHARFDHHFILWEHDPLIQGGIEAFLTMATPVLSTEGSMGIVRVPCIPTSEGLAQHIFELVEGAFVQPLKLVAIELYETPTSMARYAP